MDFPDTPRSSREIPTPFQLMNRLIDEIVRISPQDIREIIDQLDVDDLPLSSQSSSDTGFDSERQSSVNGRNRTGYPLFSSFLSSPSWSISQGWSRQRTGSQQYSMTPRHELQPLRGLFHDGAGVVGRSPRAPLLAITYRPMSARITLGGKTFKPTANLERSENLGRPAKPSASAIPRSPEKASAAELVETLLDCDSSLFDGIPCVDVIHRFWSETSSVDRSNSQNEPTPSGTTVTISPSQASSETIPTSARLNNSPGETNSSAEPAAPRENPEDTATGYARRIQRPTIPLLSEEFLRWESETADIGVHSELFRTLSNYRAASATVGTSTTTGTSTSTNIGPGSSTRNPRRMNRPARTLVPPRTDRDEPLFDGSVTRASISQMFRMSNPFTPDLALDDERRQDAPRSLTFSGGLVNYESSDGETSVSQQDSSSDDEEGSIFKLSSDPDLFSLGSGSSVSEDLISILNSFSEEID